MRTIVTVVMTVINNNNMKQNSNNSTFREGQASTELEIKQLNDWH